MEQNVLVKPAVDRIREFRNKFAHAEKVAIPQRDFIKNCEEIEKCFLIIARVYGKEQEVRKKLQNIRVRPLDEALYQRYHVTLLEDARRRGQLKRVT